MNLCEHPAQSRAKVSTYAEWCNECGAIAVGNSAWQMPKRSANSLQALVLSPVPMILRCHYCGMRHIDEGEFATKPHHTHACQHCGECWRPAIVPTVGVWFLPGFKNGAT
jgi:hypothetical protein